jgi:hypothetical protein
MMYSSYRSGFVIKGSVTLDYFRIQAVRFEFSPAKGPREEAALIPAELQIDEESAGQGSFGEDHFAGTAPFFQKKS